MLAHIGRALRQIRYGVKAGWLARGKQSPGRLPPYKWFKFPLNTTYWAYPPVYPHIFLLINTLSVSLFSISLLKFLSRGYKNQGSGAIQVQSLVEQVRSCSKLPQPRSPHRAPRTWLESFVTFYTVNISHHGHKWGHWTQLWKERLKTDPQVNMNHLSSPNNPLY